jgi:hypothetical protein
MLVSSLLLAIGACATGTAGTYTPPKDPMFWEMWQDQYGGNSG